MLVRYLFCFALILGLLSFSAGCGEGPLNNPYPDLNGDDNTLYTSFSERPKHLDPARSYSSNEWIITNQIYEPPLQYHYLKRPYQLEPLIAVEMPKVTFFDEQYKPVDANDVDRIAYSKYLITIKPNVLYQPHPAFAKDKNAQNFLYHNLSKDEADDIATINDFKKQATRELRAEDFVYQIKRLADPALNSPIFGVMQAYILGFDTFRQSILEAHDKIGFNKEQLDFFDLRTIDLAGVKAINDYQYEITLKGHYPQLLYWLAMPFFAPMPWEAAKFYAQDVLAERNLTLDWYPVGTGPYLLLENNPNLQIVLSENPNFHGEKYPLVTDASDIEAGLLAYSRKPLPFMKQVKFVLEKESIPYWNKFLQGYYDQSGITSDSFDQAIQVSPLGSLMLSDDLKMKGIKLQTSVLPTTFYWGFNMLDSTVGGLEEKQKKLRQAISIVFDIEEFINIFQNGRGESAHSLLPPGILGFAEDDFNKIVYQKKGDGFERKSIEIAKGLLKEAGYPNGIDPKTQKPLVLHLDAVVGGGPDSNALYSWIRKQFRKLGISLVVRDTQYNRFQDKMRSGDAQIFSWGWNADYPDPENFLFLLYGPNGKVKYDGENAANYDNAEFNRLFEKMKSMDNSPERLAIIQKMIHIAQEDAPWIWGYHPKLYSLSHQWLGPNKPNAMSRNTIKYLSINAEKREQLRTQWNQPITWPVWILIIGVLLLVVPAILQYRIKIHKKLTLFKKDRE